MKARSENRSFAPLPLVGICDLAKHRFRPVVTATTRCEGGRKEFEILMVCSRCGYARNARQLLLASEQLARDVMTEVEKQTAQDSDESPVADTCDEDQKKTSTLPNRARKKVN